MYVRKSALECCSSQVADLLVSCSVICQPKRRRMSESDINI